MKKLVMGGALALGIFATTAVKSQPVSDHAVIPVAITLNQVLRLHVTEGGNIEFVLNTIEQYRDGIDNAESSAGVDAFYNTNFEVASSTEWDLDFGAETSVLNGTDDPANTIALNNIGFAVSELGTASCCALTDDIDASISNAVGSALGAGTPNGLPAFPVVLMTSGGSENAGDVTENNFIIHWECGTTIAAGTTPMNATTLLDQSISPDRYVTNVLMDLNSIP